MVGIVDVVWIVRSLDEVEATVHHVGRDRFNPVTKAVALSASLLLSLLGREGWCHDPVDSEMSLVVGTESVTEVEAVSSGRCLGISLWRLCRRRR